MKKKIALILMVIIAFFFGISGYLIGKNHNFNLEVENVNDSEITTFLEGISSSDVIAIYFNLGLVREYLLTSQYSIEKILESIQSYNVEKLEYEPSIVCGGSVMVVYTRDECYSIAFSPSEYKAYCGEFYTTNNNKEFSNSIMRIYFEDVKENNPVLYQSFVEDGYLDFYYN